jgi:hypothetical protein
VTSQALMGIQMSATARGHLVSGGRVERNWGPGIRIDGTMNVIEGTWFEGNVRRTLHARYHRWDRFSFGLDPSRTLALQCRMRRRV